MVSNFEKHYVCPTDGCDWFTRPTFEKCFFIHEPCCPECGADIPKTSTRGQFLVTRKWVSESKLFKPSTWGSGKWVYAEKSKS